MSRLFLRLYVLIVASVIGIGVLLNAIWTITVDERLEQSEYEQLATAIALQWQHVPGDKSESVLAELQQSLGVKLELLATDDIPADLFEEDGVPVQSIFLEEGEQISVYTRLPENSGILKVTPNSTSDTRHYQWLLLLVFYGLIALAVLYWIWPLSKDLNHLENTLADFDENHWEAKVKLPAGSAIAHLARTYNRQLDKIKRLVENEKAMASAISHELRTPLARIRFALQMAQESGDSKQIAQQLASVEEDVAEMNRLISELLGFASLDRTTQTASFETGDIGELINTLLERLGKNYPDHTIRFEPSEPTSDVRCDSYLMERALQNLIVNACKYGRKKVVLNFHRSADNYHLRIEDDGDGIPANMREKIFDSFFRLPDGEKPKGFGLGLAIVQRVIELHAGSIRVSSSDLGGALFEISWPISRDAPSA